MNPEQLKKYIESVLEEVPREGFASQISVYLLLLTSATESNCGEYIRQTNGPAMGIFQNEPDTEKLVWKWALENDTYLFKKLMSSCTGKIFGGSDLAGNLRYQILLSRINYWAWPQSLPDVKTPPDDDGIRKLAEYWKKYWNTEKGKGTIPKAIEDYCTYIKPYV